MEWLTEHTKKYKEIWKLFGEKKQIEKTIEELDELKNSLKKYLEFGDIAIGHVAEEIADVNIMLRQLEVNNNLEFVVDAWSSAKHSRIARILEKAKKEVYCE